MPAATRDAMYRFQGNPDAPRGPRGFQSAPRNRPPQNQRFSRPGAAHLRPLLRIQQNADDRSFVQPSGKSKFRNIDDITDSDEDEMSQSDEDDEELRPVKRLRTGAIDSPAEASTPKWSNPDPYTALPPPTEATGKRTDVVQLIRKAKISDDTNQAENDLAKNEDFISFDGGFDDQFPDVPRGPKAEGLDHLGKRKRDDSEARPRRPRGYPRTSDDAPVLREWAASGFVNSTPWLSRSPVSDSAATASV
jgi:non-canonical poly(A) RNA polymerase PAPD5/7